MSTDYQYSIASDFPNHKVASDRLTKEIQASAITIALDYINTTGDVCDIWFKADLPTGDVTVLNGLVAVHSGENIPNDALLVTSSSPKDIDGRDIVSFAKPIQESITIITHDWCDPTTWCLMSIRVVAEVPTETTPLTVYTLAHPRVIDTYHGLLTGEDFLKDSNGNSYRVVVTVNDVVKSEVEPHTNSGDFTVNYLTGVITFITPLGAGSVVKATYHYSPLTETASRFLISPAAGKILTIGMVESQFSLDIELTDTAVFQIHGWVESFAPHLCTTNGGPYPPGTRIPLTNPRMYKAFSDYQNEAKRAYPQYSPLGGSNWRAQTQPILIFNWDYDSPVVLESGKGMEISIALQHSVPFEGWMATMTFYCTIRETH